MERETGKGVDMEEGSFYHVLKEQAARYPLMEPQDYCKLAFQSAFGAEHMVEDAESARANLIEEWEEAVRDGAPGALPGGPEDIGGGLCRLHLAACPSRRGAELLADLFLLTVRDHARQWTHGAEQIDELKRLDVAGLREWVEDWESEGCPLVRHSEAYRNAYRPHYRVLRKEYGGYFPILLKVCGIVEEKGDAVIAIDGRCASGKTYFARLIGELFDCNVVHMDDFYLSADRRPENWTRIPGGNMDFARFRDEILAPAKAGETISYRPYNCRKGETEDAHLLPPRPLTVVEGSYSHHPSLEDCYDFKIFLTCSKEEQKRRLYEREGGHVSAYEEIWGPMEENYFKCYGIGENSHLTVDTSLFFSGSPLCKK